MANRDRFESSRQQIEDFFNQATKRVYKQSELQKVLLEEGKEWSLGSNPSPHTFIDFLIEENLMIKIRLPFPHRRETRYCWGEPSEYALALSLRENSYLTHQTAAYLHGLVDGPLNNLYVNFEQSKRLSKGELTQEAIDRAFKNQARITRNRAKWNDLTIWLLNGMYTNQYGVIEIVGKRYEKIRATNLIRTLIDIAVRPFYAGGVAEVMEAYRRATGKVAVEEISTALKEMGHIYPYHQAVGFYLESARGFDNQQLETLRNIPMRFDFYLAHHMGEMEYSKEWRLYYPRGLIEGA